MVSRVFSGEASEQSANGDWGLKPGDRLESSDPDDNGTIGLWLEAGGWELTADG
jgi:hypothetical protein